MKRFLHALLNFEGAVAVVAYAITIALLLGDVISREVFSQSIWGAQKIAVFGAIVAGILGLTIAVAENGHLRPTFADGVLRFDSIERIGDLVSGAIFAGLGYYAVIFVTESYGFGDKAEVINIPLWPIQLVFPYAFFSAAFRHFVFALKPELKPKAQDEG